MIEGFEAHLYDKIVQMNLFQYVLPTKQVVKGISKTDQNCRLFDKCVFDNKP